MWRYREALHVPPGDAVTLGEGMTPLVAADFGDVGSVHFKLDYCNPTGSCTTFAPLAFYISSELLLLMMMMMLLLCVSCVADKDRGASVLMSHLQWMGGRCSQPLTQVKDDSSGNAGSALACYAARCNIPCEIYTPSCTSEGKLCQVPKETCTRGG